MPLSAFVVCVCLAATAVEAGDGRTLKLNQNSVGLLSSESTWLPQTLTIASALQHAEDVRVLPIAGQGTVQAVSDLSQLQSVDAAILPLDTLTYARAQGLMPGLEGKITYVARLSTITWALVAPRNVESITALAGKRIATGPTGSAGFVAGELVFNSYEVPFARVPKQADEAMQALQSGIADAALVNSREIAGIRLDAARFHVLNLPVPDALNATYVPAILTDNDLPALIPANTSVETISSPLAIMVFNWPRGNEHYFKLRRFSEALFSAATELNADTNIAAEIPGWKRHPAADEALTRISNKPTPEITDDLEQGDGQ